MKKTLLFIYSCIVGFPFGFSGEGNLQWYNFLALVIGGFYTFTNYPNFLMVYVISASFHMLAIFMYDYFDLEASLIGYSIGYVLMHVIIFSIYFCCNLKWALVLLTLYVAAFFTETDYKGDNFLMKYSASYIEGEEEFYHNKVLIPLIYTFHTLWFGFLLLTVLSSPALLKVKIATIIACIAMHPLIDFLEGDSHNGTECFLLSLEQISLYLKKQRKEEIS